MTGQFCNPSHRFGLSKPCRHVSSSTKTDPCSHRMIAFCKCFDNLCSNHKSTWKSPEVGNICVFTVFRELESAKVRRREGDRNESYAQNHSFFNDFAILTELPRPKKIGTKMSKTTPRVMKLYVFSQLFMRSLLQPQPARIETRQFLMSRAMMQKPNVLQCFSWLRYVSSSRKTDPCSHRILVFCKCF